MKRSTAHSKAKSPAASKVRIIGGQWRRRMLPVLQVDGLRPTGDRVRETLFNWLTTDIRDARCLDLFAGTGALGLEALSRGASFVQFIEKHSAAASQLQNNLVSLKAESQSWGLHTGDSLLWLQQQAQTPFDLVFLDPPFAANLWQDCLAHLINQKLLANEALIYVESPSETKFALPEGFMPHKYLKTGAVQVQLFKYSPDGFI